MNGRRLGHVGQLRNGNLELVYDEGYREVPGPKEWKVFERSSSPADIAASR